MTMIYPFSKVPLHLMTEAQFEDYMAYLERVSDRQEKQRRAEDIRHGLIDPSYRRRDRLGRFVKPVPYEVCKYETGFYNDDDGFTHGHEECGGLIDRKYTHDDHITGWMCLCIDVLKYNRPSPDWNVAPSHGNAECESCGVWHSLTSFPTATDSGYRYRDTRICRKCTADRREAKKAERMIERDYQVGHGCDRVVA
jgi:hypothetical protein